MSSALAIIGGFFFLTATLLAQPSAAESSNSEANEQSEQRDARMAWWRDARFGMFVHWGIYAVPAHGEWYMNNGQVPRDTYAEYAGQFDPTNFNAGQWAKIAKAAGVKYVVITSKHHDGFCMFRTKATRYNVVDDTPWHKDPLQALSKACRRQGIKFCVYYSIMDWHSPDQECAKPDPKHPIYNPTSFVPGKKEAYIQYMKTELKELVTQYHPAVLWFDGQWMDGWTDQDGQEIYRYLHALEPGIIVNDRVKGAGDYETPEQYIPPNGLPGHDWETCMTINNNWGYDAGDQNFKPVEVLIRNLIDIASKGGNYLLNVGPTASGIIPQPEVKRLQEMGKWLKVNGEAIYGTAASPFKRQLPWGRCTQKASGRDTLLYLHVFDWPVDGRLIVPGLRNVVRSARILADGRTLKVSADAKGVVVSVPAEPPDGISSTIVLTIEGAPDVENPPLDQNADGTVILPAIEATLHGNQIRYQTDNGRNCIGYWLDPSDWVEWQFGAIKPGKYAMIADIAAVASGSFAVQVGDQKVMCKAPDTGSYDIFKQVELGTIELPTPGVISVSVKARADDWQPFNLRFIKLTPVDAQI